MRYSVVIPAFNEEEFVGHAINALKRQSVGRDNVEIIVVDNNSKDQTSSIARSAGADIVVTEEEQGTNMARQRGYSESRGEIIAFLDADCEPPEDWLEKIDILLEKGDYAAVSGPYRYGSWKDGVFTIFPYIGPIFSFIFRKKAGVIMGGNFALPRSTMEKIESLPKVEFYGDDTYIAVTIARKVGKVFFTPELWVKSSDRRFKKEGTIRTTLKYLSNFLKVYFKAKV